MSVLQLICVTVYILHNIVSFEMMLATDSDMNSISILWIMRNFEVLLTYNKRNLCMT
jgi:hypothetical protein